MATAVRRRIGVMVPSTNTTCEADFNLVVPRGVTVHGQRLWMTNDASGDAAYARMNAEIETGARYLATARSTSSPTAARPAPSPAGPAGTGKCWR